MAGNPNIREVSKATQFKPGQSGNPTGRVAGLSISRLVRDALLQPSKDGSGQTRAQNVADKVVTLAEEGDRAMIPLVWRYMDGEPKDALAVALEELAERIATQMGRPAAEVLADIKRELGAA